MTHAATGRLRFPSFAGQAVEARFDAGRLTSDGGLVWVAEADRSLGLGEAFRSVCPRVASSPEHSRLELVRQRIFQIACGYADQNDAATLMNNPG